MSGTSEGTGSAADSIRSAITERYQAVPAVPTSPPRTESELHDYRAAFNAAHLAMAVVDRSGYVVAANAALAGLLGTEPHALVEQCAADLVDLGAEARTWQAYQEVLRGGRPNCAAPAGSNTRTGTRCGPRSPSGPCPAPGTCCCPSPTSATAATSRPGCGTSRCTTR